MKWIMIGGMAALAATLGVGMAAQGQTGPAAATYPQGQTLPWGQTSDQIAWLTFAQVVAPSGAPNMQAAEFETWASDQDIYRNTPVWPALGTAKKLQPSALGAASLAHGSAKMTVQVTNPSACEAPNGMPPKGTAGIGSGFPPGACIGEEVRRNWASYQYIVRNRLYTQAGLARAFAQPNFTVSLPADSIEFKGDWVKVSDLKTWLKLTDQQVHQLYYTNSAATGAGAPVEFALVSFHFSTKQLGDWVWSDFEHEMNPGRCDTIGCHDSYGATTANVEPNPTRWQRYAGCAKTQQVSALLQAAGLSQVWSHYCLKGSQVTYTQPDGKTAVLLGNSVIEAIAANVPIAASSCQSCHATASFNKDGAPNRDALRSKPIGNVDPALMKGYKGADFVWGILFAPPPPPSVRAHSRR